MADFPSIPFTTVNISSNHPTVVSKSISGVESRFQTANQFFSFTADFNNITDLERRQITGFLAQYRGNLSPFTIDLPGQLQDSTGTNVGAITVTAGAAGATSVTLSFFANIGTVALRPGDLIKFNHNKVYTVVTALTALSSGTQTRSISIYPPLRQSVVGNAVTYNDVPMYVRCTTDQINFSTDSNYYASLSLDFLEVLQ